MITGANRGIDGDGICDGMVEAKDLRAFMNLGTLECEWRLQQRRRRGRLGPANLLQSLRSIPIKSKRRKASNENLCSVLLRKAQLFGVALDQKLRLHITIRNNGET